MVKQILPFVSLIEIVSYPQVCPSWINFDMNSIFEYILNGKCSGIDHFSRTISKVSLVN